MMEELFSFLRGERVRWRDLGVRAHEFLAFCDREELRALVFAQLAAGAGSDWPPDIRHELAQSARDAAATEMLRWREIVAVLEGVHARGVRAVVIKGAALAYSVYAEPAARPRLDTDLVIDAADRAAVRGVLEDQGYAQPPYCDELFAQIGMERTDRFGITHVFDVHWQISTQPVFARVLTHVEILSRAVPVAALGPYALGPCAVDALLLACIHPVMHHQNAERILWTYDTHLLASSLTHDAFHAFGRLAHQKKIAAVCAHQLRRAQSQFDTRVPADVLDDLSTAADEPSAAYLASHRRWHDELASSVRGLPGVGDRVTLLRHVLLPSPAYMLGLYGLEGKPLGPWLLPALYVHRNICGAWKILTGKK